MRQTIALVLLCSLPVFLFSQDEIQSLVNEGIQLHDQGEFEKAVSVYQKALEIDSLSAVANYEISLTYLSLVKYEQALMHLNRIPESDSIHFLRGSIMRGSALDMLGKPEESINLFEGLIEKGYEDYLLYFNMAVTQFKMGKLEDAEENIINALAININHGSSHLILTRLQSEMNRPVQALLAGYYFLFLEPNTQRTAQAFQLIEENYGRNVQKDGKNTTITYDPDEDSPFSPIELQLSILSLSDKMLDDVDLGPGVELQVDENRAFLNKTESFFQAFKEVKKKKREEGIWWSFYVPFYESLAQSDHMETFCNYITMAVFEKSSNWLEENESKLDELDQWLQEE